MDDLEVCSRQHPIWWRKGRYHLRPEEDVHERTRAHDSALYGRAHRVYRTGERRSCSRYEYERAGNGVDDGYLFHAHAPDGNSRCYGKADQHRWVARTA